MATAKKHSLKSRQAFDWREWLSKQGYSSVLLVAVLTFVGYKVLIPLMDSMARMSNSMENIERSQEKILSATVSGAWRSTEPPSPAEVRALEKP